MAKASPERASKLIEALAGRWEGQPIEVLRPAFALLMKGTPAKVSELAAVTGKDETHISAVLRDSLAALDAEGNITALFGVGFNPTPHRIIVGDVTLNSCCALVAHTTAYLFDAPVTIETTDPITQRMMRLDVSPNGVDAPQIPAATLVDAEVDEARADPGQFVCRHLNHFENQRSAAQFASGYDRRYVVAGGEFHAVAKQLYETLWRPT